MRAVAPYWIDPADSDTNFPAVELALRVPDGLLAVGGNLSPQRLVTAYRHGIFPWYNEGQPILWWSPDPRSVLFLPRLKISRSLRKTLAKQPYTVSLNRAFREVVTACAGPRKDSTGTWITAAMLEAYCTLHQLGLAHSVECWRDNKLAGGLYGVAIGRVFFGESMFSAGTDASKVAFVHLVQALQRQGYALVDCQVHSDHLARLGAELIPRRDFIQLLDQHCDNPAQPLSLEKPIDQS
ncbi:MAG TPA: leucyl/phenylalanyl-tRNA--protein transferase [Gammaproteobacteria bacterium]|nr:leucyl/phenylalanyl-tRNA--protein transferase [Gammaproteobacteria bacterium]